MDKLQVKLLQFFLIASILYLIYKQYHVETIEGFPSEFDLVNLDQIRSNSQYLDPSKVNDEYVLGTRQLSCWGGNYNYISCCHGNEEDDSLENRALPQGNECWDDVYTRDSCCPNSETLNNIMNIENDSCLTNNQGESLIIIPSMDPDNDGENVIQNCVNENDPSLKLFSDINEARMIFGLWPCVGGDKDINIDNYANHHISCQNGNYDSCTDRNDILRTESFQESGRQCNVSNGKTILDLSGHLQCTIFSVNTGNDEIVTDEVRTYYDCFKNLSDGEVNIDTECINDLESLINEHDGNFYCHIKHGEIKEEEGNQILTEGFVDIQNDGAYVQQRLSSSGNTLNRNSYYFIPNEQTISIFKNLFDINIKEIKEGRLPYSQEDCIQDLSNDGHIERIGYCPISDQRDTRVFYHADDREFTDNIIVKNSNNDIIFDFKRTVTTMDDDDDEILHNVIEELYETKESSQTNKVYYIYNGDEIEFPLPKDLLPQFATM